MMIFAADNAAEGVTDLWTQVGEVWPVLLVMFLLALAFCWAIAWVAKFLHTNARKDFEQAMDRLTAENSELRDQLRRKGR